MPEIRPRFAIAALALVLAAPAFAQDAATEFVRVARGAGHSALQTAIVTYVPRDDPGLYSVDLVSAVHLGDRGYYAELNERLRQYDALLYELVAPAGSAVAKRGEGGKGVLSSTQLMLGNFLDLTFQLNEINYDAANFVHADLSPDELRQSMTERNESLYVYFWRLYYASLQNFSRDPYGVNDMAKALAAGDGYDLKTAFAYELADTNMAGDILGGETGSALIGARNERALEVLRKQLDAHAKRVGIFYGAAHLPDMERRLFDDFGLVRQDVVWLDAWRLGSAADR